MHLQLRGSLRRVSAAGVIAAAAIALPIATAVPSHANSVIQATGVTLNADANCSNANLDLAFTSTTVDTETGHSTNLAGEVLGDFTQSSSLSNRTGFVGYGIHVNPDQPDGTVIGSYASIGVAPASSANTAEFFVLYRCHTDGAQEFIYSCSGDFGFCPKTAAAAATRVDPTIEITPSAPVAGTEITASGRCLSSVVAVTLGTTASLSDTFANSGIVATVEGAYTTSLTLPIDAPASMVATVICGDGDIVTGTASVTVAISPATTATTATPATTTTVKAATPAAVQTTATFTG